MRFIAGDKAPEIEKDVHISVSQDHEDVDILINGEVVAFFCKNSVTGKVSLHLINALSVKDCVNLVDGQLEVIE